MAVQPEAREETAPKQTPQRPFGKGLTVAWTGHRYGRDIVAIAAVGAAYFLGAKLGLHIAFANKNVTAVWPPTGISVAALLLLGLRVSPGIALGAFLSNLSNGAGPESSILITVGNTLAPIVAWLLIERAFKLERQLERVQDVAGLLLLGGPIAMTVSATLGSATLDVTGALHGSTYGYTWLTWWVGDAMGVVIVTPLILVIAARCWRYSRFDGWHAVEAAFVLASIAASTSIIFTTRTPLSFLALPVAAWAAVRFFQLGAGIAVAAVAGVSIAATVKGYGPFTHGLSTTSSLITLQAFNGALAFTTLMLAAASLQNARAQAALRRDATELENLLHIERQAAFDNMTSVVAHDLRNPLGAIINSHYLLRDLLGDDLREDARHFLEMAEREAERALKLVEGLRDYRHLKRLSLSEVDLRRLVERAVEITPAPPGITMSIECPHTSLAVDADQMIQVLTNLFTNAYEAMEENGRLEVNIEVGGGAVSIIVADTGPGFDERLIDKVFDPFLSTKTSGTGLGLPSSRDWCRFTAEV